MVKKKNGQSSRITWAYAYEITPAQAADRLRPIATLIAQENALARRQARNWTGRVVLEQQVTHILVVSDGPAQDLEVNLRLEAGLRELKAGFSMTAPLAIADDAAEAPGVEQPSEGDSEDA